MKVFLKNSSTALVCTLLTFSGALQATTVQPEEIEPPKEHIVVGSRPFSLVDHITLQEERAAEEGEVNEITSEQEEVASETKIDEEGNELQAKFFPFTTSNLTTTHPGIYQNPLAVSPLGDTVELSDGSIWSVQASDRYKTFNWLTSDQIIIRPNHNWLSIYQYNLVNLNTKKTVAANLSLGPIYNGVNTHWIVAIDYVNYQVCLEDGTVWKMKKSDRIAFNKWIVNDTVIIGVNDGYFSSKSSPNILINVNVLNNARGAVMY
ncbi:MULTISPECIES: hypothetical protein [Parachlamydia]|jgi:hypothetical protein|uniref:Uncharacterized protein n=2 Tax=Parachlamydia acanthamoebae TaxID=83552 RepID=F8L0Y1_PARAV|nr:hypothetical protein [Parachlamydia acanthamoebae]EFB42634.1 hypothetical protein pah_c004o159 [Parachlamydia acanthamoebae str. Hall's coccus]KIA77415.1 hypothetical protein DB43_GI00150 [Parachlamydia acanthamoebae]CCB86894.1 putative uncharacterized protein [Parachlamydia acanthamoebae UV-7]